MATLENSAKQGTMGVEFVVGEKYRNRRGEYEVLEITAEGRLKIRYLTDGALAELDATQQARIIENIRLELATQAQLNNNPKTSKPPTPRPASKPPIPGRAATPARSTSNVSSPPKRNGGSRTAAEGQNTGELRPMLARRTEFTKLEVLRLLTHIGFGNPDGGFWFIGPNDLAYTDGNATLSERNSLPEFQKEFADAAIYKHRFEAETGFFYGSPIWQYANYLVTRLKLSPEEQTEAARKEYFTHRFGALDGEALLTDIISLPTRSLQAASWPYQNSTITDSPLYDKVLREPQRFVEDQLTGRDTRITRLRELYQGLKIQKTAPRFIFGYGRTNWRYYKEIFPKIQTYTEMELSSHPDKGRPTKAAIGRDEDNGSLIILTPLLSHQEGVTYFYLDQLIALLQRLTPRIT